ncbi:hypothetical protein K439DRAFT_1266628, partial [Ramaria rubella]
ATSTLAGYSYAINRYISFCTKENVPSTLRWPANKFILCAFATLHVGSTSGNTVRCYMAALRAWHNTHNVSWHGSTRLAYILSGIDNLAPLTSKRPPHPPITRTMLRVLHTHLALDSPFDASVYSAACCAFWGQCRLGELLFSSLWDYNSSHYPTTRSFSSSPSSVSIHLPWTKITKTQGAIVILAPQFNPLNPIQALQQHIVTSKPLPNSHLFAYQFHGTLRPLTCSAFLNRCNQIWVAHGYPQSTGHSFHISGTMELLLARVQPDVVKAMGQWSSDSFLVYWRSLGELAPLH